MNRYDLSVDIGMVSTRAAVHRGEGVVEVVELGPVHPAIRTSVFLDRDGGLVVGEAAARRAESDPAGASDGSFVHACAAATPVPLRDDVWRPEDLFARVLRTIVERVATMEGAPAQRVGAIVPTSFDANALRRLEAACVRVGMGGVLFVPSVQAIASAYVAQGQMPSGPFVAVDLAAHGTGIGQFASAHGAASPIVPGEAMPFGGTSCDTALLGLLANALGLTSWSPQAARAARGRCRDAKEQLSAVDRTQVTAEDIQPGSRSRVDITRASFEAAIADEFGAVVRRLTVLRPSAIAVAGGTSYIPSVRAALEQVGVPLLHDIDPIYAPVMGGALVTAEAGLFRLVEGEPGLGSSSATVVVPTGFTPIGGPGPSGPGVGAGSGSGSGGPPVPPEGAGGAPDADRASRRRTGLLAGAVVALAVLVGGSVAWNALGGDDDAPRSTVDTVAETGPTDSVAEAASGDSVAETASGDSVVETASGDSVANTVTSPGDSAAETGSSDSEPAAPSGRAASAFEMVEIAAGTYPIGSPNPDLSETLRTEVQLERFFIDVHEVTNAEYKAFVDRAGGFAPLSGWPQGRPPEDQLDSPVRGVNFAWAEAYCSSLGKRLPTESQWEVASGGKKGLKFAWGEKLDAVDLPTQGVYPVKSVAANVSEFKVHDLTGNAWEWVRDPYDANRVGPGQHVLRGGQNGYIRSNWTRLPVDPEASTSVLDAGLRCAAAEVDPDRGPAEFDEFVRPPDPKRPEVVVRPGYRNYDDFTDSSSGWIERTAAGWRYGYHPNKFFHLETKKAGETVVALAPTIAPTGDIVFEATAQIELDLTDDVGTYEWGLVIRADLPVGDDPVPRRFVALVIDNKAQTWRAYVQDGEERTTLAENPFNVTENDELTIQIRDRGESLEFSVRNRLVLSEDISKYGLDQRRAGFIVTGGPNSLKTHVHFGRFAIKEGVE